MSPPTIEAELPEFPGTLHWVETSITKFNELISRLQEFMESVDAIGRSPNKTGLRCIRLIDLKRGDPELLCLWKCRSAMPKLVTLSHRYPNRRLCVFIGASNLFCLSIVTQILIADMEKYHNWPLPKSVPYRSERLNNTQLV